MLCLPEFDFDYSSEPVVDDEKRGISGLLPEFSIFVFFSDFLFGFAGFVEGCFFWERDGFGSFAGSISDEGSEVSNGIVNLTGGA